MPGKDDLADPRGVREINEGVDELLLVMSQYDHVVLDVVEQHDVENPLRHERVRRKLIDWHSMVMLVFSRLRPYIRNHLEDEYWDTLDHPELVVQTEDGERGGLQLLDELHSPFTVNHRTEHVRSKGRLRRSDSSADLLSPRAYRTVTQLLTEARTELGFGPQARKETTRSKLTQDMMEELEDWRQDNLGNGEPEVQQ